MGLLDQILGAAIGGQGGQKPAGGGLGGLGDLLSGLGVAKEARDKDREMNYRRQLLAQQKDYTELLKEVGRREENLGSNLKEVRDAYPVITEHTE